jgi:tuberculosinol/isotuberculosinol synthase
MQLETFQNLPTEKVAQIMREAGRKICVFPINGTRRWFILEHPEKATTSFVETYVQTTWQRQLELYKLCFDHGIDTLLTPLLGPDILERGGVYDKLMEPGLSWFAYDQDCLDFYEEYGVRVRIYGDARRHLQDTPYAHILESFDRVTERTAHYDNYRLFFGVYAHDAVETTAEIGARFYQEHGHLPDRRQIVQAYYGEYVEPVDFFIGFDRLASFDMPLIATGNEDLYFTVSPSPYMDAYTLRAILYDHLYARRVDEASYKTLSPGDWQTMREFYALNRRHVLGLGHRHESGNFWFPIPQVKSLDENNE